MSLIFQELEYPQGKYLEEIQTHEGKIHYLVLNSQRRGKGGSVEFFFWENAEQPDQIIPVGPGITGFLPVMGPGRRPITIKGK